IEPSVGVLTNTVEAKGDGQPVRRVHQAFIFGAVAIKLGAKPVVDASEIGSVIVWCRSGGLRGSATRRPVAIAESAQGFPKWLGRWVEPHIVQSPGVAFGFTAGPARVGVGEAGIKVAQVGDDQVGSGSAKRLIGV